MAKSKLNTLTSPALSYCDRTEEEISSSISDVFKVIDDLNPAAKFLNENSLSNVKEWIDTGSLVLNGIISGSLYGGVPMGRLTGFIGPESCGKTLMANKIMANAQKKGMQIAYFDTEGALDEDTAKRLGCDPSKVKHVPTEITEQCRNQLIKLLNTIVEKNLNGKFLIVIDSLGNLITAQEKKKMEEGSDTPDMGNRAKTLKSMMRAITHAAAKANCPVVFTNHIYDDPSQLHASALKKQAGGSGPLYMASVIVQMAKKTERVSDSKNKDSNEETTFLSKDINGLTLRALTTKNRFVVPFLECEMYLNFRTGLNKYSGLVEMAEAYGVLEKVGHRYAFNGEMLGFFKDWKTDEKVWKKILPSLEEKLQKELSFKNEMVDSLEENEEQQEDINE
jgi:recombination protein RecA